MAKLFSAASAFLARLRDPEQRAPLMFTISSLWLSVAQMVSGLLVVRFVDPRDMGVWTSANLALTYAHLVLAGIQNGLSRELPYTLGAGKAELANRLAGTVLSYTRAACLFALLGGIGVLAFMISRGMERIAIYSAGAVAFLIMVRFYQNYLLVTFRSKNSFLDLARVQGWNGAIMILALPLLYFGFGGLVGRAVLVGALGLYLMHRSRPLRLEPAWRFDSFLSLCKTGLPIFATDYILNSAATLDRVALLNFGGLEQVGFYALAGSASSAFAVVPQSIAAYAYPRMSHRFGSSLNPRDLWSMAWRTSLITIGVMIPIAIAGAVLLPYVVPILFPKYLGGIRAAQIALFSSVAFGGTIGANALASMKAWPYLLTCQLSHAAFLAIGPYVGAQVAASPIEGVAYGLLAANLMGATVGAAATFLATRRTRDLSPGSVAEPVAVGD